MLPPTRHIAAEGSLRNGHVPNTYREYHRYSGTPPILDGVTRRFMKYRIRYDSVRPHLAKRAVPGACV
eukprot:940246-Pleurochrysis_carterae.AAC.1